MSIMIPETLAATLGKDVLDALMERLAPPMSARADVVFEIEVEAAGEGTFVLAYQNKALLAKKGFAKSPLLSVQMDKAAWPLVREQLQAAVDGFPQAPHLQRAADVLRGLSGAEVHSFVRSITAIKDAVVRLDVKGAGKSAVGRGPIDEATNEMTVGLDAQALRLVLQGAPLTSLQPTVKGDRGVAASIAAAAAPLLQRLRR